MREFLFHEDLIPNLI